MKKFKDLLQNIKNRLIPQQPEQEMLSPLPDPAEYAKSKGVAISGNPSFQKIQDFVNRNQQGEVLGATNELGGRSPNWKQWKKQNPKRFEELLSGTQLASTKHGVPQDLLMDIAGLETSGGANLNQFNNAPGQGYYQFEPETLRDINSQIDPYSATESADLAGELIKSGQLSRWGTPEGNWGTLANPKNTNGMLINLYSPEELNKFLSEQYQL